MDVELIVGVEWRERKSYMTECHQTETRPLSVQSIRRSFVFLPKNVTRTRRRVSTFFGFFTTSTEEVPCPLSLSLSRTYFQQNKDAGSTVKTRLHFGNKLSDRDHEKKDC